MKKLIILSEDSIFAGCDKTGMAEIVDSMANSLNNVYNVTVVCPDRNGVGIKAMIGRMRTVQKGVRNCRFLGVEYYLVHDSLWPATAIDLVEQLNPDILHSFADPIVAELISNRPSKVVCTLGNSAIASDRKEYLKLYDAVMVNSENLYREILKMDGMEEALTGTTFVSVPVGVLTPAFDPTKGLLLSAKYSSSNLSGKQKCKERLLKTYNIPGDPCVYLMTSRLITSEGFERVFSAVETIRDTSGVLVVLGKGLMEYEQRLLNSRQDGVVYIPRVPSPIQIIPMTAGADFYLSPSETDSYGLYPMTASRYGAIPMVTQFGGHADNFNSDTAIIIDEKGLSDAVVRAANLYADKDALNAQRKICMETDYSWITRREKYVEIYEK